MTGKIYTLIIAILIAFSVPTQVSAVEIKWTYGNDITLSISDRQTDAINNLNQNVVHMAETINDVSSEMMKFGDILICNAFHGARGDVNFEIPGIGISIAKIKFVQIDILFTGCILYVLGFFIMMIASFYMFDVAFNLSMAIVLLPIALALWPFRWTQDKLGAVVNGIVYYIGVFIFLPLGILIASALVGTIVKSAIINGMILGADNSPVSLKEVFDKDMSDVIASNFGPFTSTFLMLLLAYIVAIRIIPLMANEFCGHFFGSALIGNPMSQRLSQFIDSTKKATVGKVAKYGKDVVKHQTGKAAKNRALRMQNSNNALVRFAGRVLSRAGYSYEQAKK